MLSPVQQVILTCLFGPEDPKAFQRVRNNFYRQNWVSRKPDGGKEWRKGVGERYRKNFPEAAKASSAKWQAKNPCHRRNHSFEKKYGISLAEVNEKFVEQRGLCAICGTTMKNPHVDHCHSTGKVREMLCGGCNRGIGFLKDSPEVCFLAGEYLKKWGSNCSL